MKEEPQPEGYAVTRPTGDRSHKVTVAVLCGITVGTLLALVLVTVALAISTRPSGSVLWPSVASLSLIFVGGVAAVVTWRLNDATPRDERSQGTDPLPRFVAPSQTRAPEQ